MTKKFSIAGLVVAAAASSSIALSVAPAKAACTGSSTTETTCDRFDPSSSTTIELLGYGDAGFAASTGVRSIVFGSNDTDAGVWNFSPSPITISNIEYSFDNGSSWSTTNINTSVTLASNSYSANIVTANLPGSTSSTIGANKFRLKFTVPGVTTSNNGFLYTRVSAYGNGIQQQTRFTEADAITPTATGTPGPLPLIGAGMAFGFSRRLRSRVRIAA